MILQTCLSSQRLLVSITSTNILLTLVLKYIKIIFCKRVFIVMQ